MIRSSIDSASWSREDNLLKLLFILTAYYGVVQAAFPQAHTQVSGVSDWAVRSQQDALPQGHLLTFQNLGLRPPNISRHQLTALQRGYFANQKSLPLL